MSGVLKVASVRLGSTGGGWHDADCYLEVTVKLGDDTYRYNAHGRGGSQRDAVADAVGALPETVPDGLKKVLSQQLTMLMVEGISQ